MLKRKLIGMAVVIALCGSVVAGAAEYTILEKAQKMESTIYGDVQTGALADRVDALDKEINGKSTVSGSMQSQVNSLYTDVYGNTGSDLSMLAAVNMMQWKYSGQVTNGPLVSRVGALEEGVNGQAGTGSLEGRIASLRQTLLGNEQFVSQQVTIPAGTVVQLKNLDALSSKTLKKNDSVQFAVAENVMVDDIVAIPSGAQCSGTITDARKSGVFGRDGKLVITYDAVKAADGTYVPVIVGEKAKEEYKRTAGAVGASAAGAIILGPVGLVGGLFVHGKDVNIPAGSIMYTEVKTNTDVVGFKVKTTDSNDMKTANLAAGGIAVPGVGTSAVASAAPAAPVSDQDTVKDQTVKAGHVDDDTTPVNVDKASAEQPVVTITPSSNKQ